MVVDEKFLTAKISRSTVYNIERGGECRIRVYCCGTTLRKVTHPHNDIHACNDKVLNRRQPHGHDLAFTIAYLILCDTSVCCSSALHELMATAAIKKCCSLSRPAIASTSSSPTCWIEATIE